MSYPISESMYLCFLLVGLSGIVIEIAPISSNLSRYFRLFCLKETRSIPFSMSWAEISSWALSRQIANKPNSFMDISWTHLGHIELNPLYIRLSYLIRILDKILPCRRKNWRRRTIRLKGLDNTTTKARECIVSCQTSLCVSPHNMPCSSGN